MKLFPAKIDFQSRDIQSIVVTNSILIGLAIFFKWSIGELMLMFWLENIVLGFYGILKIALFNGQNATSEVEFGEHRMEKAKLKLILVPFFIIHFGFFCFIHGFFIDSLFGGGFIGKPNNLMSWESIWTLKYGILAIFINYGVSFFVNYIGKKERKTSSIIMLFIGPYQRIIIIHLILMISGILFIVFLSKTPAAMYILFFFGVKMILDLRQQSIGPLTEDSAFFANLKANQKQDK